MKGYGVRLNLMAEPIGDSQLPNSIKSTPTHSTLELGYSRITVGLRMCQPRRKALKPKMSFVNQHST